jgi:hypothetical protein
MPLLTLIVVFVILLPTGINTLLCRLLIHIVSLTQVRHLSLHVVLANYITNPYNKVGCLAYSCAYMAAQYHPGVNNSCCIHGGACIIIVAIATTVREALPATNAMLVPTEGAAGLASNLQAWLR